MGAVCAQSGKQRLSRSDALRIMRDLVALDRMAGTADPMNIYRCRDCRRWHVGHVHSPTRRNPRLS